MLDEHVNSTEKNTCLGMYCSNFKYTKRVPESIFSSSTFVIPSLDANKMTANAFSILILLKTALLVSDPINRYTSLYFEHIDSHFEGIDIDKRTIG